MNFRPATPLHRDDRDITLDAIRREFLNDPYVMIDLVIYHKNGTIGDHIGLFEDEEIDFRENELGLKKRGSDQEYIITNEDQFVQNWYANRMGYIIRLFRE